MHALRSLSAPLLAAALVGSALCALQDRWRWTVTPYAWATDVHVDVALDGRGVVDETIPVADLLEDLDTTFQGRVEAKHGELGLYADVFYVSLSDEVDGVPLPQGAGSADLGWGLDMTIADVAGVYDPRGDDRGFEFLLGARVIDQRMSVDASLSTSGGTTQQGYDAKDTLVDLLAGVRYSRDLTDHLSFHSQLDVSSGGTELTWSMFPSLQYSFGDGRYGLLAGYRHLEIQFEEEGGLDAELAMSGPVLGFRMSF